jgi:hypothetical protein
MPARHGGLDGEVPEWLKGTDCKSVGFAYAGSNPALSTKLFLARFHRPIMWATSFMKSPGPV